MQQIYNIHLDMLPDCTKLRNILPRSIMYGQQDVTEFFDYLMKLFNYEPILVTTKKEYKSQTGSDPPVVKKNVSKQNVSYISINNDGTEDYDITENDFGMGKWEDLGEDPTNWVKNQEDKPFYRFIRSSIVMMEGDTIIMTINRGNAIGRKYNNKIIFPDKIKLSSKRYFLFATISHINNMGLSNYGHYITILSDTNGNRYIYNDMSSSKIINNKVDYAREKENIQRNCIMLFYYRY